jgi:phospholipase/carboxylesterase
MSIAARGKSGKYREWKYRFRPSIKKPSRLLILLHGWTGDENSMWIFARRVPPESAVISPRGPFKIAETGYSWRANHPGLDGLPIFDDFRASAEALVSFIDGWASEKEMNFAQFDLIGFSQGAAISYAMALLYPARVRSVAALSGFIPGGAETLIDKGLLKDKPVYISHGRQDDKIPVQSARDSIELLIRGGAKVAYCETDGGHKVSANCFSSLEDFIRGVI